MSQAQRVGFCGASGTGKTTKALQLAIGVPHVILQTPFPDDWNGAGFTYIPGDLGAAMREYWSYEFRILKVPEYGQEARSLERISSLALRAQRLRPGRPLLLIVDELNTAFPVTAQPSEFQSFGEICSRGRHYGISVIGISQRMAEVNARWRGNLSGFYVFRLADARDIQTVRPMLPPGAEIPREDFKYLWVTQGRAKAGQVRKR